MYDFLLFVHVLAAFSLVAMVVMYSAFALGAPAPGRSVVIAQSLDGIGGFDCYGTIENADAARAENLLPMGLAEGCRLTREVEIDEPITFDDVERPSKRLTDELWSEQLELFSEPGEQ